MTYRDFYNAIVTGSTITDEIREFAKTKLDKLPELADNTELVAALKSAMADGKTRTASEIVALGIDGIGNTSKATSVVKSIDGIKVGEVRVGSRVVKTYSL